MRILVVSDTHGRDEHLDEALKRERPIQALIHCGDVEGREAYIQAAAGCPVYMVEGNNDFFSDLRRELLFELGGKRIFLTHGHYYGVSMGLERLAKEAAARRADAVFFGHTHQPLLKKSEEITLFNPGSLTYPRQSGRKPSYGVLEISKNEEWSFAIKYLDRNSSAIPV